MQLRPATLLAIVSVSLLASGCASREPDLEAPTVDIIELYLRAQEGTARLRLDNPVPTPMPASAVSFEMLIENQSLGTFDPTFDFTVPPLGSETLSVNFEAGTSAARLLATGTRARVEYILRGELRLDDGRVLTFDRAGWLTPTPGKPGSWR